MTLLERMERRPAAVTMACVAVVGGLLALHYGATLHRLGLHDFLRGLAAIGYLPHIPQLAQARDRVPNNLLELIILIGVGALVGTFADAESRLKAAVGGMGAGHGGMP